MTEPFSYKEMKESHKEQIAALMIEDYPAFMEAICVDLGDEVEFPFANHYDAWGNTGSNSLSLFGTLPQCNSCLTQIAGKTLTLRDSESVKYWDEKLGISDNELVPKKVSPLDMFTRAQLQEFSRLQLLANFPEGDVT